MTKENTMLLMGFSLFLSGVIVTLGSGVLTLQGFLLAFVGEVFQVAVAKA